MTDQQQHHERRERRVQFTATVDYELSVPASWLEDPESEYRQDPDEAVFTWIVDNADRCITGISLDSHSAHLAHPERGQKGARP